MGSKKLRSHTSEDMFFMESKTIFNTNTVNTESYQIKLSALEAITKANFNYGLIINIKLILINSNVCFSRCISKKLLFEEIISKSHGTKCSIDGLLIENGNLKYFNWAEVRKFVDYKEIYYIQK